MAQTAAPLRTPSVRTFSDPALHLTFSYPAELQPQPLSSDDDAGCSSILLTAAMGTDPNQPGADQGQPPSAKWATLAISEMGPDCIPPRALKKIKIMDQMLAGMAGNATQALGLMPMEQPFGYLVEGHHIYLSAAQGSPVVASQLQPANGKEVLAVLAAQVGNHVVTWRIVSNDTGLVNRILTSHVDFGLGTPQPLYPGHIGQ